MDNEQKPIIDLNAIKLHFEIIGPRENGKYHVTVKKAGEDHSRFNGWLTKEEIIAKAQAWTDEGYTIWVSVNDVEEGKDSIKGTQALTDLFFDIDAKRADKNIPATKEEKKEAGERAVKLKNYIEKKYKVQGFIASSGNGFHLHFPLPRYELKGEAFREEVNAKVTAFSKRMAKEAGVETDSTFDIRRVSTLIGTFNQKIQDTPLKTEWEKDLMEMPFEQAVKEIQNARNINETLVEAILNENAVARVSAETEEAGELTEEEKIRMANRIDILRAEDEKLDTLLDGKTKGYKSRSEAEFALLIKLFLYGFTEKEAWYIMNNISNQTKWKEAGMSYKKHSIEKAKQYAEEYARAHAVNEEQQAPVENPLEEGEDPLEVLLNPVRKKVLLEPAIETIILAGITAYLDKPLNLILLKKKTAEGGSYTLINTLDIFPPEDVLFLDYVTPTAFFHEHTTGYVDKITNEDLTQKIEELKAKIEALRKDDVLQNEREEAEKELKRLLKNAISVIDLRNKIIVFSEPAKSELFENLKPLLSADREEFDIIATNKSTTGRISTEHIRIIGHPVFMLVLSEDEVSRAKQGVILDPQLYSRFLKAEINTSHEKFVAGKELIARRASGEIIEDAEYDKACEKARQYIRWLREEITKMKQPGRKSNLVLNPFALQLVKYTPSEAGEDMRLFRYLITLIEARTVIYMPKREIKTNKLGETVIVTAEEDVNTIFTKYAPQIISHLPPSILNALERLKEILKEKPLSREEIFMLDHFEYSSSTNLYRRLLLPLVNEGYLEQIPDPQDPRHRRVLYMLAPPATGSWLEKSTQKPAVANNDMKQIVTTPPSQFVTIVTIKNDDNMKHDEVGQVIQPEKRDLHNNVEDTKNKIANAKNSDFPSQLKHVHETEEPKLIVTTVTNPPSQLKHVHETEEPKSIVTGMTKNPDQLDKIPSKYTTTSEPVAQSGEAPVLETPEPERVLQEAEARLREKLAHAKPACVDGENIHVEAISNAHGKCTGFFGEDSILPEFLKYGNKLYVLHCKDGAVAYVCGVCRVGYVTLQGFEQHAKEVHGWTFTSR